MSNQNPAHVVTNKVRLSYCNLFTPKAKKPGDEPKYSTTLLIPKSDVATRQRIDAAIGFAIQEGTASKWNGVRPPIVPVPIHDGDGVRPSDGMPFEDECKGHWVMTASDKNRPEVVDLNLNPIINQSDVYSGMYARVSIRFFAYVNNGKKGIGCGLGNVQKLEDGVPLSGGRTSANEDFGGAPAYPQQVYQQPPIQTGYQQPAYVPQQQAYTPQGYQQPPQPAYNSAAPVHSAVPYGAVPQGAVPYGAVQPVYPLQQPVQIDPITGKPLMGNVMGL